MKEAFNWIASGIAALFLLMIGVGVIVFTFALAPIVWFIGLLIFVAVAIKESMDLKDKKE